MARTRKTHTVARGCLQGEGPTKREALIDLNKQVDWACQYNPLHVETYLGWVIVVAPNSYGYSAMSFDPTEGDKVHSFRAFVGRGPIEREIRHQRLHVAQMVWSGALLAAHDEEFIETAKLDEEGTRELRSWIKFQRLYAAHKAAGATPAECHERACRNEPVAA